MKTTKMSAAATQPATSEQFRITRVASAYWRVTINNPPFNIYGPDSMPQLGAVITQIEEDPKLKVVVFDSAVPGFFLTHYDFVTPVVSIVSIRGRALRSPATCGSRAGRRRCYLSSRSAPASCPVVARWPASRNCCRASATSRFPRR